MSSQRLWALVCALAVVLSACSSGGAPASTVAVGTPTPVPTATPAPTADAAALFQAAYARVTSASMSITGTARFGNVEATFTGTEDFNGPDSRSGLTMTTGGTTTSTENAQIGGTQYAKSGTGPWLVDTSPPRGSPLGAQLKAAAAHVVDQGTTTRDGLSVHQLVPFPSVELDPVGLGLTTGQVSGISSSITFFAASDGTPRGVNFQLSWNQVNGTTTVAATVSFDIAFTKLGNKPVLMAPEHVWQVFSSAIAGFSIAYPDDFDHTTGDGVETFVGPDGGTYAFAARQDLPAGATLNMLAQDALDKAKKALGTNNGTNTSATLAGEKARLLSLKGMFDEVKSVFFEVVAVHGDYVYFVIWVAPDPTPDALATFESMLTTFRYG